MRKLKAVLNVVFCFGYLILSGQPDPCEPSNPMTSTCATACVVCDIDGFTGVNNLTAQGQTFPEFCTTSYDNMQYISFIAGSVNLSVTVEVSNCQGGVNSLEVGFFYTADCQNFEPITICDTDINSGESQTFTNNQPLIIGQHYYLIMDGSWGANCNWTFNVIEGTTVVSPLSTSGVLSFIDEVCPGATVDFSTTAETGATIFDWYLDGVIQSGSAPDITLNFPQEGTFEICVVASNVCDMAPPTCETITVRTPGTTTITESICDGDCVEINGINYCNEGSFTDLIPLPIGCDSTLIIDISFLPNPEVFLDVWICDGESFEIGNTSYTETGIYQESILTAMNCDSMINLELLVIQCEIEGFINEEPVRCFDTSTGSLIFGIDVGTPPFNYTYTNLLDPSIVGSGTTNLMIGNNIDNLPAGIYQIYITDDFGNDLVLQEEITSPGQLIVELVPTDFGGFNISCFESNGMPGNDGSIYANVLGGTMPYIFQWSSGDTAQEIFDLEAQSYTVTITDANGCTAESLIALTAPNEMVAEVVFMNPDCDGFNTGVIEVLFVNGGTPSYQFSINNMPFQENGLFENLSEGTYTLNIEDSNGCVLSFVDSIFALDIPMVDLGGDITISLGDSIQFTPIINVGSLESLSWIDSLTLSCANCLNPYALPYDDVTYTLTVTSGDGCTGSDQINVFVEKQRRVYIPNIFSPNGDGLNEIFTVYAGPEADEIKTLLVYDRWGEKLFEASNFKPNSEKDGWDGTFKNKELNPGVYSYFAEVHFIDDVVLPFSGEITLNR